VPDLPHTERNYLPLLRQRRGHEALTEFTVSNIWAMDVALAEQLERWPSSNDGAGTGFDQGSFANNCPHCGALQAEYLLHSEPGDVFFGLSRAESGSVKFIPVAGRVQMGGDFAFEA
jgi:hypothetical protein